MILLSLLALSLLFLQYPITALFDLLDTFSYTTILKGNLIWLALVCLREPFRQWLIRNTREQTQINSIKRRKNQEKKWLTIEQSKRTNFLALVLFGKSTTTPPVKPAFIACCVISSSFKINQLRFSSVHEKTFAEKNYLVRRFGI